MRGRTVGSLLVGVFLASGCARTAPTAALQATNAWIDRAAQPHGDEPLIGGEPTLCGLRITGGVPPYRIIMKVTGQVSADQSAPVETTLGSAAGDRGVEVGLAMTLEPRLSSGHYLLQATVIDHAGRRAEAVSAPFVLIGANAPLLKNASDDDFYITDRLNRSRSRYFRGESLLVHRSGDANARPFQVPRGARTGPLTIQLGSNEPRQRVSIAVGGEPFPPAGTLKLETLRLYGGYAERSPRGAQLRRGEALRLDLRVAAVADDLHWTVRFRSAGGIAFSTELAPVSLPPLVADERFFLEGHLRVPNHLPAGSYTLEVTARQGDALSTLYRPIVLE